MDASSVLDAVDQAVETVEAVDLTPVLESLGRVEELLQGIAGGQMILVGVILAAAVVLIWAVMWR